MLSQEAEKGRILSMLPDQMTGWYVMGPVLLGTLGGLDVSTLSFWRTEMKVFGIVVMWLRLAMTIILLSILPEVF
jgi:hypothetical protein